MAISLLRGDTGGWVLEKEEEFFQADKKGSFFANQGNQWLLGSLGKVS